MRNFFFDNADYIGFATPFLFSRIFTPFRSNELISERVIEGIVFSASAFIVHYNLRIGNLEDFSYSYFPIVGSIVYHRIEHDNQIIKFAAASAATIIFKTAMDVNLLHNLVNSVIIYGISSLNGIPNKNSAVLAVFSSITDYYLPKYYDNTVFWSVLGGLLTRNLYYKYLAIYNKVPTLFVVLGGGIIGFIATKYAPIIMEQFFAPSHFMASYNTLAKFVDRKTLDLILEQHFITMANLQIGMGFYGNYLLKKLQEKTNLFCLVNYGREREFKDYISLSVKFFGIASIYVVTRTAVEGIHSYNERKLTTFLQDKLVLDNLLKKENFILTTKTNYTTQSYLDDVEVISISDNQILKSVLIGIPKLSKLQSLTTESYIQLSTILAVDYSFNIVFQYLIGEMQKFSEQQALCASKFAKINERDKESAAIILQKNALNYAYDEWNDIQQCIHSNSMGKAMISNMITSFQVFYNEDLLYIALHMLVAHMSYKGIITLDELYLYTRTLETLINTVLFGSKNQASFNQIESAVGRLNKLFDYLKHGYSSFSKISLERDLNAKTILIENLEFTRGDREQEIKLYISQLELVMSNIYAITGANGCGKSSLVTLLLYTIKQIEDSSFDIKSGKIIYPSSFIEMIPQKDYIPFNTSLFDLIMYPNKSEDYPGLAKSFYQEEIIKHINGLHVFQSNITSNVLYNIHEDWKELSGGQKKKLFLIKELITCPKILIMDEFFGPLDSLSKHLVMQKINESCLNKSLLLVVWHQEDNFDIKRCINEPFFDYELHVQNNEFILNKVGLDCS